MIVQFNSSHHFEITRNYFICSLPQWNVYAVDTQSDICILYEAEKQIPFELRCAWELARQIFPTLQTKIQVNLPSEYLSSLAEAVQRLYWRYDGRAAF